MGKDYWTIWTATLLFFAAFYTLLIPFPLYLAEAGLADWQIALVMGAFGIASLLVRPLAGVFSDVWGRRRVMIIGALSLVAGSAAVTLTVDATLLFGLRVLQAAGYVAFTTAATAVISDLAPAGKRASAMALFGTAANLAMTTTPAVVHAVLHRIHLSGAFLLSGALAVVSIAMALQAAPKRPPVLEPSAWSELMVIAGKLRIPLVAATLFGISFGAFFQFLPLLTERRGLGPAGTVFTVYGASLILTRLITAKTQLLDRHDRGRILLLAFLLLGGGLGGFAAAGSQYQIYPATVIFAAGAGTLHPLLIAIHVGGVSAGERGRAGAVFYFGFDLGIGAGAWVYSPVFQWFGMTGLFCLAALTALSGCIPARAMREEIRAD